MGKGGFASDEIPDARRLQEQRNGCCFYSLLSYCRFCWVEEPWKGHFVTRRSFLRLGLIPVQIGVEDAKTFSASGFLVYTYSSR